MKKKTRMMAGFTAAMMAVAIAQAQPEPGTSTPEGAKPAAPAATKTAIKLQTTCPVMGGDIDKGMYVDHEGKRIYICCKGCEGALKKDAAKYIKKLEDEGVTVATLQTSCPVMSEPVNKALYVDHDGQRIYVCCEGCIATIKKDPAQYVKDMEAKGVALEAVPKAAGTK